MDIKEMKELVNRLNNRELDELMRQLMRSGKVIIPQYYNVSHVKNFNNHQFPTSEQMHLLQETMECEYELHEDMDNRIESFFNDWSENNK